MYSDEDLDESKFVSDNNEEMTTPSQSSQDDALFSITSSLCSVDFLVVDEVRCSSDEVEDQTTGVGKLQNKQLEQTPTSTPQTVNRSSAPYHCHLCGVNLSDMLSAMSYEFIYLPFGAVV
jgi:hypothetical protein